MIAGCDVKELIEHSALKDSTLHFSLPDLLLILLDVGFCLTPVTTIVENCGVVYKVKLKNQHAILNL